MILNEVREIIVDYPGMDKVGRGEERMGISSE